MLDIATWQDNRSKQCRRHWPIIVAVVAVTIAVTVAVAVEVTSIGCLLYELSVKVISCHFGKNKKWVLGIGPIRSSPGIF